MAQLGRFHYPVQDTSGNAVAGVSVDIYREGATVNGNQTGTSPFTVTVYDSGKILASDTVFANTTTGTTYSVNSITDTTVVLSGFLGSLSLTSGDRLVPSNSQPTVYSDDQGTNTTTLPLTSDSTGIASCFIYPGLYEILVSGGSVTTRLFQEQVITSDSEATGIINVRSYGAFGNDSTDDTTAIQAALTDIRNTAAILYFPPGTYKITAALSLGSMNQRIIRGAGRSVSVIKQYTDNTPVISITSADTHSITLEDMEIGYSSQQSSGNTSAIALNLSAGDAYWWHVNRVMFRNVNTGIGISGTGQIPWWGSTFENIRMQGVTFRGISLDSPTAIGMPCNVFRQIQINNSGVSAVATSEAIRLEAQNSCVLTGIDIEDWKNTALYCYGGGTTVVNGIHLERITVDVDSDEIIRVENEGTTFINGFDLSFTTINVATSARIFNIASADHRLTVSGMNTSSTTLTSGVLRLMTAGSTPKQIVFIDEPILDANVSQPSSTDNALDVLTLYGVRQVGIIKTFTASDATPDVSGGNIFKTANAVGTTITMFDGGVPGQTIHVIINDANTTIDFSGTNLEGNVGVDWTPTTNDHMTCVFDGTNWFCNISDNTA